jgi:hypothetical protein
MKTDPKPLITISFAVDLEIIYDPFHGRTTTELGELLQDKIADLLFELTPDVQGVFTSITNVDESNVY